MVSKWRYPWKLLLPPTTAEENPSMLLPASKSRLSLIWSGLGKHWYCSILDPFRASRSIASPHWHYFSATILSGKYPALVWEVPSTGLASDWQHLKITETHHIYIDRWVSLLKCRYWNDRYYTVNKSENTHYIMVDPGFPLASGSSQNLHWFFCWTVVSTANVWKHLVSGRSPGLIGGWRFLHIKEQVTWEARQALPGLPSFIDAESGCFAKLDNTANTRGRVPSLCAARCNIYTDTAGFSI